MDVKKILRLKKHNLYKFKDSVAVSKDLNNRKFMIPLEADSLFVFLSYEYDKTKKYKYLRFLSSEGICYLSCRFKCFSWNISSKTKQPKIIKRSPRIEDLNGIPIN